MRNYVRLSKLRSVLSTLVNSIPSSCMRLNYLSKLPFGTWIKPIKTSLSSPNETQSLQQWWFFVKIMNAVTLCFLLFIFNFWVCDNKNGIQGNTTYYSVFMPSSDSRLKNMSKLAFWYICGVDGPKLLKQVQLHKIEFNLCKKERFFVKVIDVFNSHTVEKAGKLKIWDLLIVRNRGRYFPHFHGVI